MRVVVAIRHEPFRRAVRDLLAAEPAVWVVDVADLRTAGTAVRRTRAGALVVDLGLLASERARLGPVPADVVIVALGMDDTPARAAQALDAGAHAYVVRDRVYRHLVDMLRERSAR